MTDFYNDGIDNVVELKFELYNGHGDFRIDAYGMTNVVNQKFNKKNGLILFYSPNCGHCKNPEFIKLWKKLSITFGSQFVIGAVNCTDKSNGNHYLTRFNKILGYPTIKFVYRDGTMGQEYNGPRTIDALKKFICKKSKICYK